MEIITDLRILKAIEKLSDWRFDREYKYHIGHTFYKTKEVFYKNNVYRLQYFDGCFYPYCVKVV